ncbi:PREDICTED: tetraspanin-8-like isoform X2 [Ipomoea nil]|uniref:tetraspanin-8-like isoform X1 n=1 Tax=Ipomoea nil TaxID=35883 RepID=UPI0009013406|nr:PREDICTED: tetraspanin-8-like isoform X1 [Ipomoea nil]XP_019178006.1 PREDICTED: tetraspanin-8-like isoform X1 [Ipomoea nil]XP_019178008.1 PREDICTED: tetraspanin-8-like isoform X2 [Ipomoea nil]
MVRVSNNLLGILNIITFLISIPIIGGGIWLSRQANTECERFLDKPVIALGVFIMLLSLAGLVGACCRVTWLLWIYLFVMFLLILLLFCFTIFAFVVTNKGAGEAISGKGYKEYRLGDYSNWLQRRVNRNWRRIRSCIEDSKVCKSLIDEGSGTPVQSFYNQHLSALQSGCCKPSDDCKFEYVSPTNWTRSATSSSTNPDCNNWSNEANILCYNCQSCKAGLIDNIKSDWKKVAILNIIFIVFLIIVYTVGCCAFRNNRADDSWKRYP